MTCCKVKIFDVYRFAHFEQYERYFTKLGEKFSVDFEFRIVFNSGVASWKGIFAFMRTLLLSRNQISFLLSAEILYFKLILLFPFFSFLHNFKLVLIRPQFNGVLSSYLFRFFCYLYKERIYSLRLIPSDVRSQYRFFPELIDLEHLLRQDLDRSQFVNTPLIERFRVNDALHSFGKLDLRKKPHKAVCSCFKKLNWFGSSDHEDLVTQLYELASSKAIRFVVTPIDDDAQFLNILSQSKFIWCDSELMGSSSILLKAISYNRTCVFDANSAYLKFLRKHFIVLDEYIIGDNCFALFSSDTIHTDYLRALNFMETLNVK